MNKTTLLTFLLVINLFICADAASKTVEVSSQEEFNRAMSNALPEDTIVWLPGAFRDVQLRITKSDLIVKAKIAGQTVFSGSSKVTISGSSVTFEGFQFINGDIGSANVIDITGTGNYISEVNISGYTCYKYLVIKELSQYITVRYCNFENRVNLADKNILSILVNKKQPGFHRIQYCSFKNFRGNGGDMGIEPIRIGTSVQAKYDSKSVVEYCYFTKCNGDGEIISNKSGKNIFRYNTFTNNPMGELVLRHGSGSYVYGNFFLNGKGGVRIKEGGEHYVFNNYFSGLKERSIVLQSDKLNPLRGIYIMYNTFVASAKIKLGKSKTVSPKKVMLVNNIFDTPRNTIVGNSTGNETWIGNMYNGTLGITARGGLRKVDPMLTKNKYNFYEINKQSRAINASEKGCPKLPAYKDLDLGTALSYDILEQKRPIDSRQQDVGCQEFNPNIVLRPFATRKNTGPSYLIMPRSSSYTYESF